MNIVTVGYTSYTEACATLGIDKLSRRRETITEKFALKAAQNEQFSDRWFPLKKSHGYNTRAEDPFYQNKPRMERMTRGPLYKMTHMLNALAK